MACHSDEQMPTAAEKAQVQEEEADSHSTDGTNEVLEDIESGKVGMESSESASINNVNLEATETDMPTKASEEPAKESDAAPSTSRRRRCRPTRRCGACFFLFILASSGMAALFWPGTPTWEVTKIHVEPDALNNLISSIMDPNFNSTELFGLIAEVEAWNPNRIGASVGVGKFNVTHGPHTLATAETDPLVVDGNSKSVIKAHSLSKITPEISSYLMGVLPGAEYKLIVDTDGQMPAKVWGFLSLQVRTHCTVEVEVMKIITDPDNMVLGHNCTYSVGL